MGGATPSTIVDWNWDEFRSCGRFNRDSQSGSADRLRQPRNSLLIPDVHSTACHSILHPSDMRGQQCAYGRRSKTCFVGRTATHIRLCSHLQHTVHATRTVPLECTHLRRVSGAAAHWRGGDPQRRIRCAYPKSMGRGGHGFKALKTAFPALQADTIHEGSYVAPQPAAARRRPSSRRSASCSGRKCSRIASTPASGPAAWARYFPAPIAGCHCTGSGLRCTVISSRSGVCVIVSRTMNPSSGGHWPTTMRPSSE